MLLSRMKVKDGRLVTKDEEYPKEYRGFYIHLQSNDKLEAYKGSKGFVAEDWAALKKKVDDYLDSTQDSITEGSKIVVNTDNHVNESAIAVTINKSDCLVRFENGDEETVPIEAVSAFESMANDECMKDEDNPSETETKINELKQNMDAARARGYDTAPYQKEIDRLKSMDEQQGKLCPGCGSREVSPAYQTGYLECNKCGMIFDPKRSPRIDPSDRRQGKDKYTGDPLTDKGKEIMASLKEQYGEEKGEQVFYAMKNSGQIEGID